jgi:hypothetical protein
MACPLKMTALVEGDIISHLYDARGPVEVAKLLLAIEGYWHEIRASLSCEGTRVMPIEAIFRNERIIERADKLILVRSVASRLDGFYFCRQGLPRSVSDKITHRVWR